MLKISHLSIQQYTMYDHLYLVKNFVKCIQGNGIKAKQQLCFFTLHWLDNTTNPPKHSQTHLFLTK